MAGNPVPAPDSQALLRFLDFIYAVVFTTFVRNVYDSVIFASPSGTAALPWTTLNEEQLLILGLSACVFYVVAVDWIHARVFTGVEAYPTYTRFFVDLGIAFLAYGALVRATQGAVGAARYVFLIFAGGMVWAGLALWQHPTGQYRRKLRLVLVSHLAAAIALLWFCWNQRQEMALTWSWLWRFIAVLGSVYLFEEFWHAAAVPRSQWLGPSALPIPRAALRKAAQAIRGAYLAARQRFFTDPPPAA